MKKYKLIVYENEKVILEKMFETEGRARGWFCENYNGVCRRIIIRKIK